MKFIEMKTALINLEIEKFIDGFAGFEESDEFEHFKLFYQLNQEPYYTIMQMKNSDVFKTSEDSWLLCLPKEGRMYAIDAGSEDEICDQFYNLIELMRYGFGVAQISKK